MPAVASGTSALTAWLRAAIVFGVGYFLIARLFPQPAEHLRAWRLAAWVVSGIVYATHFWYERVRLRCSPRSLALHLATGVAIGAFALALAGLLRSLAGQGSSTPKWLLALVLFPAFTAAPAFLVALVAAVALSHRTGSTE
jgi:hypothetical protein